MGKFEDEMCTQNGLYCDFLYAIEEVNSFSAVMWIRLRVDLHYGDLADPDPNGGCRSGSRRKKLPKVCQNRAENLNNIFLF